MGQFKIGLNGMWPKSHAALCEYYCFFVCVPIDRGNSRNRLVARQYSMRCVPTVALRVAQVDNLGIFVLAGIAAVAASCAVLLWLGHPSSSTARTERLRNIRRKSAQIHASISTLVWSSAKCTLGVLNV